MPDALRVAVIGAGAMGANHARVFAALPDARLTAVADPDEARARAAASTGATPYADYAAMLEHEALDAVSIAVPARRHLEVALACIERRLPLLVEKPLGADLDECLRLKAAAEERSVPLMAGHIERFNPVVQEIKRRLDAGDLGRVYEVHAERVGPFFDRERDIGVVHDLATHDIDLLHWLLGGIEHVYAETQSGIRTPYEDALGAILRFENGAVGRLEVNWLAAVKRRRLRLTAERGTLQAQLDPKALDFFAHGGQPAHQEFAGHAEPLREELAAFVRVARGDEPPPVTANEAIAAMRVVEALVESARRGQAVRVAPERIAK